MIETLVQLHKQLFFWMYSLSQGGEEFRFWLYVVAERIDWYVVLIAIIFMLVHHHSRTSNKPELVSHRSVKEGLFIIGTIIIAWGISYLMKIGLAIPRPFLQYPEITPLFLYGGYNSFPSGHATLFAALAAAMYINHKNIGIAFALCAFLISITRVIAGVHFPIDILFGWLLGAGSVFLVQYYFIQRRKKRLHI